MKNFSEFISESLVKPKRLDECIMIACKIGKKSDKDQDGTFVMCKNRDRMYSPKVEIHHVILNGVEIVFYYDVTTGWLEGMNEYGLGFLNTALMVGKDEKEGKSKDLGGKKKIIMSEDGSKILKVLMQSSIKEAIELTKKLEIQGHSFIGRAKNGTESLYSVESTSKHKPTVTKIAIDDINVRTNHGIFYADAGYPNGSDDFKSSNERMKQAEKAVNKADRPLDLLSKLRVQNHGKKSNLNMRRDTGEMATVGQILLDLTNRKLYYVGFRDKQEFLGIENHLPSGYSPKIKIILKEFNSDWTEEDDEVEETD